MAFLLSPLSSSSSEPFNVEGFWRSEGYGLLFEFTSDKVNVFEWTSISCIPAWSATREVKEDDQNSALFSNGFQSGEDHFTIVRGPQPDKIFLRRADTISTMTLHKLSSSPEICARSIENTPLYNFDVLWSTFEENYPSFKSHNVDWNDVRGHFRPLVKADMSPKQLFEIFRQMVEPLHDDHVLVEIFPPHTSLKKAWLKTPVESFQGKRLDPSPITDADLDKARKIIESKYLTQPVEEFCNRKLRFGLIDQTIAYLDISSFHEFTAEDSFEKGMVALEHALGKIFNKTKSMRGFIIDIRFNGGGDDPFGFLIASHLTQQRYIAWAKKVRNDPKNPSSYSLPEKFYIEPSQEQGFSGKGILLTSRLTASAAEVFAMALMGRRPVILRIGENTQGVFSDVLDRRLPNGWRMVLPNELLVDEKGRTYDVIGVPPNIPVNVFSAKDLANNVDSSLERAIKILKKGGQ